MDEGRCNGEWKRREGHEMIAKNVLTETTKKHLRSLWVCSFLSIYILMLKVINFLSRSPHDHLETFRLPKEFDSRDYSLSSRLLRGTRPRICYVIVLVWWKFTCDAHAMSLPGHNHYVALEVDLWSRVEIDWILEHAYADTWSVTDRALICALECAWSARCTLHKVKFKIFLESRNQQKL